MPRRTSPPRIIALLTDFGWRDHYVAAMKGVILSIAPGVSIVDLTHEIPPQDVVHASLFLRNACRYYPRGTIFVAVVDPGVGTERLALGIRTAEHFFLAPDNGLLGFLADVRQAVRLDKEKYFRRPVSSTFHGRDIFAPVAAHLARGVTLGRLGTPIRSLAPLDLPRPGGGDVAGRVVTIDRFGNLITDIPIGDRTAVVVRIGEVEIEGLSPTYASKRPGEPLALRGSEGTLEIAVCRGSAAEVLGAKEGDEVRVRWKKIKDKR